MEINYGSKHGKSIGMVIFLLSFIQSGTQFWYQNGQFHRDTEGLPAVIESDGNRSWWQRGQLHRDGDVPAIIRLDGTQSWYQHGRFIREN